MIDEILFFGIGAFALFLIAKAIRKEFKAGKCASCQHSQVCKNPKL